MECHIVHRGKRFAIQCGDHQWEVDRLTVEAACNPKTILSVLKCDYLDLECAERLGELVKACRDAVNNYVPIEYDPQYGIPMEDFVVLRLVGVVSNTRTIIYQGGYYVEVPPKYERLPWRSPDSEVEIDVNGTGIRERIKIGDLLARLGIDPGKPYHVIRMYNEKLFLYYTGTGTLLATNRMVAPGRVRLFVHKRTRLDRLTDDPTIFRHAARALALSKKELEEGYQVRVVVAYPYPPSNVVEEIIPRILDNIDDFWTVSASRKLKMVYLGASVGGHIPDLVPHSIVATLPATGKTFFASKFCISTLTKATEASILGGANVARGSVFGSILEDRYACVQIEHMESLKSTVVKELLQLMSTGTSSRAVLGVEVSTRVYCPFIFTANVEDEPMKEFIALLSVLTTNEPAAARRFAVLMVDPSVERWRPTREEKVIIENVGLIRYLADHPVFHHKLEKLYTVILDKHSDEYVPDVRVSPPRGAQSLYRFVKEYLVHHSLRLAHMALNIAAIHRLDEVWNETIDPASLHADALDWFKDLEREVVRPSLEFVTGYKVVDPMAMIEALPKLTRTAIKEMYGLAQQKLRAGEKPVVRFSEVYSRSKFGNNPRKRVISQLKRYLPEIDRICESLGCTVNVVDDDIVFEIVKPDQ